MSRIAIAAPGGSKARLFEHMDVRVRAGPPGARSAAESSQPDVGETVMPAPMALVTFPERKATRAAGRRGKHMDIKASKAKTLDYKVIHGRCPSGRLAVAQFRSRQICPACAGMTER